MNLALMGGTPVRTCPFPSWPQSEEEERESLLEVLKSRSWGGYSPNVNEFEDLKRHSRVSTRRSTVCHARTELWHWRSHSVRLVSGVAMK